MASNASDQAFNPQNLMVVMTTYAPKGEVGVQRSRYAYQSVESLIRNLIVPHNVRLHISDDGSYDQDYIHELASWASERWLTRSTMTNSLHQGIGASLNRSLAKTVDDLWMYTTDDWLLTAPLDVTPAIKLLTRYGYDYVRLGPIHPHLQCSTEFNTDVGWWLRIHQRWGGFNFATRPFIASRYFYQEVGPFKEMVDSYECEVDYSERVNMKESLKLGCLPDIGGACWQHIGEVNVGGPAKDFIHA